MEKRIERHGRLTLVQGDFLLVANQAAPAQHGVYIVGAVAGGLAPLTRAPGFTTSALIAACGDLPVREGSVFGGSIWRTLFKGTDTLDTTSQMWTHVIAPLSGNAGSLLLTGGISYSQGIPTTLAPAGVPALLTTSPTGNIQWATNNQQALNTPYKDWCRVASTANLSLTGAATIDGVAVATGDRVLAKDQTAAAACGIYVANTAGAWTRATDCDTAAELAGAMTTVASGTISGGTTFTTTFKSTDTLGTTAMQWLPLNQPLTYLPVLGAAITTPTLGTGNVRQGSYTLIGGMCSFSCYIMMGAAARSTSGSGPVHDLAAGHLHPVRLDPRPLQGGRHRQPAAVDRRADTGRRRADPEEVEHHRRWGRQQPRQRRGQQRKHLLRVLRHLLLRVMREV